MIPRGVPEEPPWMAQPATETHVKVADTSTADRGTAIPLGSVSTDPPPAMFHDRLDPEGHTVLHGPGGVGKGALACSWTTRLVRDGHHVLILDFEGHATEWARRIGSLEPSAIKSVWYIAPVKPLRAIAHDVRGECERLDVTYVVIDSAVMAVGDDPMKPEAARAYFEGLLRLGRPTLTLAHVTKIDDGKYPFGSIFWHNLARTTWSLMPDGDGPPVLTHRKHNNYAQIPRQSVTMTWQDGQLREVWERSYAATLGDEIAELLEGSSGMTIPDIVAALSDPNRAVSRHSVRAALTRGMGQMGRFTCTQAAAGSTYRLLA